MFVWVCVCESRLRFPSSMILIIVRAFFHTNLSTVVSVYRCSISLVVLLLLLHFFCFCLWFEDSRYDLLGYKPNPTKKIVSYFFYEFGPHKMEQWYCKFRNKKWNNAHAHGTRWKYYNWINIAVKKVEWWERESKSISSTHSNKYSIWKKNHC